MKDKNKVLTPKIQEILYVIIVMEIMGKYFIHKKIKE
jgi:hypothetical protein